MSVIGDSAHQLEIIAECLQLQIDELIMLQSIFCTGDEFTIDDPSIEADINDFLETSTNSTKLPSSQLQYTLRLQHPLNPNCPIDIRIELPHLYPKMELANVSVLCAAIGPTISRLLRSDLNDYLRSMDADGEVYVYQIYQWVLDNVANYDAVKHLNDREMDKSINGSRVAANIKVERLWIYSHHLKSKHKRQELIHLARQLNLSGFSRPGKPGIVCVEGVMADVQEYWRTVRQWCWQKIQQRRSETEVIVTAMGNGGGQDNHQIAAFRKFPLPFQELLWNSAITTTTDGARAFVDKDNGGDKDNEEDTDTANASNKKDDEIVEQEVMSMGSFIKFLEQHQCGYIKKDLFGFD